MTNNYITLVNVSILENETAYIDVSMADVISKTTQLCVRVFLDTLEQTAQKVNYTLNC